MPPCCPVTTAGAVDGGAAAAVACGVAADKPDVSPPTISVASATRDARPAIVVFPIRRIRNLPNRPSYRQIAGHYRAQG